MADRLGDSVIEFKNVSKAYGDRLLIDKANFAIPPGAIVGIIGPNGAGKSTMFRMITGKEKPDSGEVVIGSTVQLAVVDQNRDALPKFKALHALAQGRDHARDFMAQRHRFADAHGAKAAMLVVVQVRTAYAPKGHPHLQLAGSGQVLGQGVDAQIFGRMADHSFHGSLSLNFRGWR